MKRYRIVANESCDYYIIPGDAARKIEWDDKWRYADNPPKWATPIVYDIETVTFTDPLEEK